MKQAVHIFKKDVRYLWLDIALLLAVVAVFAWSSQAGRRRFDPTLQNVKDVSSFLLVVLILLFPGRLVHAEAFVGERQFWLTRPYSKASLLAAKCLFLFLFVTVPLTLFDIFLLRANGFQISTSLAGLVWEQVLRCAVMLAPGFGLAAITRNTVNQTLTAIGMAVGFGFLESFNFGFGQSAPRWASLEWVNNSIMVAVIFVASAAAVLWQYARRRTWTARIVFGTGAALIWLVPFVPPAAALAIENLGSRRVVDPAAIRVEFDDASPPPERPLNQPNAALRRIPLVIRGVPQGYRLWMDQPRVETEPSQVISPTIAWQQIDSTHVVLWVMAPVALLRNSGTADHLRVTALMTLAGNSRPATPQDIGCQDRLYFDCRLPYRGPRVIIVGRQSYDKHEFSLPSYSPFPAELTFEPVERTVHPLTPGEDWPKVEDPVQHFFYSFDLEGVRLTEVR